MICGHVPSEMIIKSIEQVKKIFFSLYLYRMYGSYIQRKKSIC